MFTVSPLLGTVTRLVQCSHHSSSKQMGPFPVKFAAMDLNCCLSLLGHTRKMSEKFHLIRIHNLSCEDKVDQHEKNTNHKDSLSSKTTCSKKKKFQDYILINPTPTKKMVDTVEQPANGSVHDRGESLLKIHIERMQKKLKEPPRLLSSAAGKPTCSIFRVPQSMIDSNGRCYEPRVVSVGPYHRGQTQLRMMEEHKWHYLNALVTRTHQTNFLTLVDYMKAVRTVEEAARECYSESIHMDSEEFNEMMVLDGCFILELFRKVLQVVPFHRDDPLESMAWVLPFFYRDFLRLENQIPFFVLEVLFHLTRGDREKDVSLQFLALAFFNKTIHRTNEDLANFEDLKAKDLLDLVRSSFIPEMEARSSFRLHGVIEGSKKIPSNVMHSMSKFQRAGIKILELKNAKSFLVVRFRDRAIEMPRITVDDFMASFFPNCVAYEQCYVTCSKRFTTYAILLDCLIKTSIDFEYLCEQNIIENYLGTEAAVVGLVNSLCRDVEVDSEDNHVRELFIEVNKYYHNSWHVQWATFKFSYFSAAIILLILSVIQTIFTVFPR